MDIEVCLGPEKLSMLIAKSGTILHCGFSNWGSEPAGGASVEDLRALSQQNLSMDLATFKKLQVDALVVSGGGTHFPTGSGQAS